MIRDFNTTGILKIDRGYEIPMIYDGGNDIWTHGSGKDEKVSRGLLKYPPAKATSVREIGKSRTMGISPIN